ncbi:uncharacterized protein LOC131957679 [Physella acuta]|uniref:uncharacterized protein LOC131957679 n=1 Tax=Physella acuta TaxID=109671 RepID=UPI0027DDC546|nr:uncharacterized protein LOC131957679 [Physella acuta]
MEPQGVLSSDLPLFYEMSSIQFPADLAPAPILRQESNNHELFFSPQQHLPKQRCKPISRKGVVCSLGPLSSFIKVKNIFPVPAQKEKLGDKSTTRSVISSTQPASARLPELYVTKLNKGSADKLGETKTPRNSVKLTEPKLFKFHRSCSEIVCDLNRSRRQLAMQCLHHFKRNSKLAWGSSLPSDLCSFPDHSVLVKWFFAARPNLPSYTIESVFAILTRYGKVKAMVQLSPNSALVVFASESVAKTVVKAGHVGFHQCPLLCNWVFIAMYKNMGPDKLGGPFKRKTQEEAFNHYVRQQQKIILTSFKLHSPDMYYDHTKYIP